MNRLRKDTQKPELDDLRLEVSYMPAFCAECREHLNKADVAPFDDTVLWCTYLWHVCPESLWQPQLPSSAAHHKKRKKDNRPTFKYRSRARKKCSPESSTAQDSGQIA